MQYLYLGSRLLMAAVLLWAGFTKVHPRAYSTFKLSAAGLLGISAYAARALSPVVILSELMTAGMILYTPTARFGLVAGLLLLMGYTAGILRAISRHSSTSCACFGATDKPVGWSEVIRNSTLGAVALAGLVASFQAPGRYVTSGLLLVLLLCATALLGIRVLPEIAAMMDSARSSKGNAS